ncbi:MAG: DUF892 family protein, partial [Planctomycetota bacterium]|nr:DUF892 family protein [Planctomycetota bacterium]
MKLDHLEKLFLNQLKDAYSAETQLLKAMPKMRDAATADPLRKAIEDHMAETKKHQERVESICRDL